jgi:hypothetical protein
MRNQPDEEFIKLFRNSYGADALDAMKTLFYIRDVRGGAGERAKFRATIAAAANEPSRRESVRTNIESIPFFGRWDDLFVLVGTLLEADVVKLVKSQLTTDLGIVEAGDENQAVSLCAKWMPSINTSSKTTKKLANKLAKALGWAPALYRKRLSRLRKRINIVERLMSAGQWDQIDYSKLPSRAGMLYRKAFWNRDEERYQLFQDDVAAGKASINAGVLYPHELVHKVYALTEKWFDDPDALVKERLVLDNLWNNLLDIEGIDDVPTMVCSDTSASMTRFYEAKVGGPITPMDVSIGLAIFFAERMKNPAFANKFISFSSTPRLQTVRGEDIYEKVSNVEAIVDDTNFQAIFDLLLETGIENKVPAEDMPKRVIVISDMEFNDCDNNVDGFQKKTNLEVLREKYAASSYELPELVYWNADARPGNFPMSVNDSGTCMVAGYSPSILKAVLAAEVITPYDVFRAAIDAERYDCVRA